MNEIFINSNEKLISMCDVTKQSIGFAIQCLSLAAGTEQKFVTVLKQAGM